MLLEIMYAIDYKHTRSISAIFTPVFQANLIPLISISRGSLPKQVEEDSRGHQMIPVLLKKENGNISCSKK